MWLDTGGGGAIIDSYFLSTALSGRWKGMTNIEAPSAFADPLFWLAMLVVAGVIVTLMVRNGESPR